MEHLLFALYVLAAAFTFARVEIEIEGPWGWAERLPTWRRTGDVLLSGMIIAGAVRFGPPSIGLVDPSLAAAGTARLVFDGADVDKSDDVHESLHFDRLAARIDAAAGPHIVAAKICTGALEDSGRVRLRITDDKHKPLKVDPSADLSLKPGESIVFDGLRDLLERSAVVGRVRPVRRDHGERQVREPALGEERDRLLLDPLPGGRIAAAPLPGRAQVAVEELAHGVRHPGRQVHAVGDVADRHVLFA